jgi:AraC-like DNA-binding protein
MIFSDAMEASGSSWDFPPRQSATRLVTTVGAERGVPVTASLKGSGLIPPDLENSAHDIEARQELCVVRNVVRRLEDPPGLGAEVGGRATVSMLGILGFAMMASPTPREAIWVSDRFRYGTQPPLFLRPRVDERPNEVTIVYDESEVPPDLCNFFIERDLALVVALMPHFFGAEPPVQVTTTLDGHRGAAFAKALGHGPVELGHRCNAVVIGEELLHRRLPNADEHTARECEHYLQLLVSRRIHRAGLASRIRAAMLHSRPVVPSLAALAAGRNVDPRTLRRQLADEGTSYRQLADEVRHTLAEPLLHAGLTVEQVADRLGYADAATFTRAFKRWTGVSPATHLRSVIS